jgi:hypothetical protein
LRRALLAAGGRRSREIVSTRNLESHRNIVMSGIVSAVLAVVAVTFLGSALGRF